MTKSDYKQFVEKNFTFLAISDAYSLIDYIFEKGIEEPKTCDGCKFDPKNEHIKLRPLSIMMHCVGCARSSVDNYEPKEQA